MRKLAATFVFGFALASALWGPLTPVLAEIRTYPSGSTAGGAGGVTGTGTTNTVAKWTSSSAIGNSTITDNGTTVTINTATTYRATTDPSNSLGFVDLTATLPASPATTVFAVDWDITSAGSASQVQSIQRAILRAGYTGSSATHVLRGLNFAAGTGADLNLDDSANESVGNHGTVGTAIATTAGLNVGIEGIARLGNTNYGGVFKATGLKNDAVNVGVLGTAVNGGTGSVGRVGVLAALTGTTTALPFSLAGVAAALLIDNVASTDDIVNARDNGTSVVRVLDGGALWTSQGAKTLTSATPTAFVRVAVPSDGRQGGIVDYCVDANDATNYQTRCGSVSFSLVNEGGTEAGAVGTPADADGTPTGTLTAAFTVASNAADTMDILCNADSSLSETTLRINYTVRLFGNAATAVTPQ